MLTPTTAAVAVAFSRCGVMGKGYVGQSIVLSRGLVSTIARRRLPFIHSSESTLSPRVSLGSWMLFFFVFFCIFA